ncbi:MAG: ACP S-malonyltransferase [Firmicutes bacterium]|nr:ACP S-malonyltransferase [Bacillota bacterium]
MGKVAFVFPGQGAQFPGMGKDFYDNFDVARQTFNIADSILNYKLSKICFEGNEDELMLTTNTQPAVLVTSIAIYNVLKEEGFAAEFTAGLSLGEYSALVSSDSIELERAVKIVQNRAAYMQEVVPVGVGKMAAIVGLGFKELDEVLESAKNKGIIEIANFNTHEQTVISGETAAIKEAIKSAKALGAKRALQLPVSAPFHCSMMKPAGELLRNDLKDLNIKPPKINFVNNVDAKVVSDSEYIRKSLIMQVSSSVKWYQTIELMLNEGVRRFIEIGPGTTLRNFIKSISAHLNIEVESYSIGDMEGYKKVLKEW